MATAAAKKVWPMPDCDFTHTNNTAKQQEETDKKATRLKDMETRRQAAIQKKMEEEKQKALEEERRLREEAERRKRDREENADKKPLKTIVKKVTTLSVFRSVWYLSS
jgi:hypothetical protein